MEEKITDQDSINKLYIAYGSNLNLLQMKHRCPTAKVIGSSEIKDYELVFRGSRYSAVATIEPCKGSIVPVLLWDIGSDDEKSLDRYEGYPNFYDKEDMNIIIDNQNVTAMVYLMTPGHKLGKPSAYYLKAIEDGYVDAGFNTNILHDAVEKTVGQMEDFEEIKKDEPKQEDIFGMKWW